MATCAAIGQASAIVNAALSVARELELQPLAVTVLDPGGHPLVLKREDNRGHPAPWHSPRQGLGQVWAWAMAVAGRPVISRTRTINHLSRAPTCPNRIYAFE